MMSMIKLSPEEKRALRLAAETYGTPLYVYFAKRIVRQIQRIKKYYAPYGMTIRYAMKANPNLALVALIHRHGIHIDASTYQEVYRARKAGVTPQHILLTSQQLPPADIFATLIRSGVQYNATSLRQLELYGSLFPGRDVSVRINIGIGSSWTAQMDTGGKNSSFGIYGHAQEIDAILSRYHLRFTRLHFHIGSGSDPHKQTQALRRACTILRRYPTIHTINVGGGFKIARVPGEKETSITALSRDGAKILKDFYRKTGRKIRLEIEPGTFLMAHSGFIISRVKDLVDTGAGGGVFAKLDTGMNDNTRIPLYGAQHPIFHLRRTRKRGFSGPIVLAGECCESSDVITCAPGDPQTQRTISLTHLRVGDYIVIGGCGAYCASMSLGNYNSKPRTAEILVHANGKLSCIRKAQKMSDVWRHDRLI